MENVGAMLKRLIEYRNGLNDELSLTGETQEEQPPRHLQLIVITHDRRLVDHLFLACRPEYLYALSKDENGVSRIKVHKNIAAATQAL